MRAFAWGGTLLFGGALSWFAYQYFVAFSRPIPGMPRAADIGWNVALFSAFALHHSAFARTPVRRVVMSYARTLERPIYVWISSVVFIGVCTAWRPIHGVAWTVEEDLRWLLPAVQILGLGLISRAVRALGVGRLSGLTAAPADTTFTTRWPYGWIRHPIYLGWFLLVWPLARMTTTQFVFAAASCLYLVAAIPLEERTLLKNAGKPYEAYAQRVRWRLLPGVY